ncbi:hypothetical protein ES703_82867 [subsurface metagenome]
MAEQTVTLNPGESKVVTFEVTPSKARAYQVTVNGLTGSFVASPVPGYITITYLRFEPPAVNVGEEIAIRVNAGNEGETTASRTVECKINGVVIGTITVTLDPGQWRGLFFYFTPEEAGTYDVEVDGLTGSFVTTTVPLPLAPCPYCGYITGTEEDLTSHMSANHPGLPYLITVQPESTKIKSGPELPVDIKFYTPGKVDGLDYHSIWFFLYSPTVIDTNIVAPAWEVTGEYSAGVHQVRVNLTTRDYIVYPDTWQPLVPGMYPIISHFRFCNWHCRRIWENFYTGQTITIVE